MAKFTHFFDLAFGDPRERNHWELFYPIPAGLIILFLRHILIKYVFHPMVLRLGLRHVEIKKPSANPVLETAFSNSKKWSESQILGLSKQLDMTEEDVQEWLELKKAQNKPSVLEKVCDSLYRFLYFTFACTFGLVVLWDKPWLWDIKECWTDFYNQVVPTDVWLYFMLCMAQAWAQLIGLIHDIRRKDFYVMVAHHIVYVALLLLSWRGNLFRNMTLIVVISDLSDITLELSRVFKYFGIYRCAVSCFSLFAVMWMVIRLWAHPFLVIKAVVDAPRVLPDVYLYLSYYLINVIAVVFMILNLIWTYFIVKVLMTAYNGNVMDTRLDEE